MKNPAQSQSAGGRSPANRQPASAACSLSQPARVGSAADCQATTGNGTGFRQAAAGKAVAASLTISKSTLGSVAGGG